MRRSIQEIEQEIEQLLQDAPKAVIPKKLFENILSLNTKRGKRELNQALRSLEVQGKILIQPGNLVQLKGAGKGGHKGAGKGDNKGAASAPSNKSTKGAGNNATKTTSKSAQNNKSAPAAKSAQKTAKSTGPQAATRTYSEHDQETIGTIDISARGDGYVTLPGYDEDIRIPKKHMGTALQGDHVMVSINTRDKRQRRISGRIDHIVKRSGHLYVGVLRHEGSGHAMIEPDQKSAHTDFYVAPEDLHGIASGHKVTFRLKEWTAPGGLPQAWQLQDLGEAGSNEADILSILAEKQFQAEFDPDVEAFAAAIPEDFSTEAVGHRLDYRDKRVFTIDPADAKDFDDAISIEQLDNGNLWLGVHIADVTHYMPPGTVLDEEAYRRATSVYLVDRVIPMLPERLSNGVCSLRPNEDKCTYSCFMELTPQGDLVSYDIRETLIHSMQRFVYDEVQEILDGNAEHELKPDLEMVAGLAQTLMNQRFQKGAIAFETPEPRFVLDEEGKPTDVIVKERLFAHKLIEECMLMANKTVALHVDNLRKVLKSDANAKTKASKQPFPYLYRIHDKPDAEKFGHVLENIKPIGIFMENTGQVTPKEINTLLKKVEGTEVETIVNQLMLRAMAKAEYAPGNVGHFGLAFSHYAHFTSPIRRYPDVIVHRLLKAYPSLEELSGGGGKGVKTTGVKTTVKGYTYDDLVQSGEHCSAQERSAAEAERDSVKLKQVEYLSERIGSEYDGVISGVTENGIFVQLKEIYCEGMVRISELKDDYYVYQPQRHALVARGKKKQYQLGQHIKIRVISTNPERRQIDFALA
ncbi:MAG: ribonuclease R [Balneolaceae bacterium]|nr:ribonuclease R [Balneolaceae bacterium]